MNANIMITTGEDTIIVDISMEFIGDHGKVQRITTSEVQQYLTDNKIPFGKVLKSCSLCNDNENNLLGHWIFEKNPGQLQKVEVQSLKATRKRKEKNDNREDIS